ncbi:MAG: hypothetical protein ABJA89_01805 [Lapillicoccus sp.]
MTASTSSPRRAATEVVDGVRAAAREGRPAQRRGLWVSYLSPYALELALGAPHDTDTSDAPDAAAPRPDWVGLDLQHGAIEVADAIGLCASSNGTASPSSRACRATTRR